MTKEFSTPILLLIFNRLETTKQVVKEIKRLRPRYLFIAADGARVTNPDEREQCQRVRDWVIDAIDWPCDVTTHFQEENLGCGKHVSQAIRWFFNQVEEGIILEDDCVPHPDFFTYCETLLHRYRNDHRIFTIGGNNFQEKKHGSGSYYFSTYGHIWGWATWRRAWEQYAYDLNTYDPALMRTRLKYYFRNLQAFDHWWHIFERMRTNPIDTWDYQWSFCQWYHSGLSIMPNINLVKNIGFGQEATHTTIPVEGISDRETTAIATLSHPSVMKLERKADLHSFYTNFEKKKAGYLSRKIKEKIMFELKKRIFRSAR